jgi:hypothetical protein
MNNLLLINWLEINEVVPNKIKMQTNKDETRLFQSFDSIIFAAFFSVYSSIGILWLKLVF